MNERLISIAEACLEGAEQDTMTFPQIVEWLAREGFEGYMIDLRRARAIYYHHDGDSIAMSTHTLDVPVATTFDVAALQAAIRDAQQLVPGHTYIGFCRKAAQAGCAGYIVSFPGRRALYFGRTAETHTEHFP